MYFQCVRLLDRLETQEVPLRDHIAALLAIAKIQTVFVTLKKHGSQVNAGSTARKYAEAFKKADGTNGGTDNAGSDEPNAYERFGEFLDKPGIVADNATDDLDPLADEPDDGGS